MYIDVSFVLDFTILSIDNLFNALSKMSISSIKKTLIAGRIDLPVVILI